MNYLMMVEQDGFLVISRPVIRRYMHLRNNYKKKNNAPLLYRPNKIQTPFFTYQQQYQQTTPSLPSKRRPNPDSH